MSIVCYTKESSLVGSLLTCYRADEVVVHADKQLKEAQWRNADVVIVDRKYCALPELNVCTVPLIVLVVVPEFDEAVRLVQAGVKGYGNRKMLLENLQLAIESVKAGHLWLPPEVLMKLVSLIPVGAPVPASDPIHQLSVREREVADYVGRGMSNLEMAEKMFVSLRTVKAHLSSIYEKTGFRNRLELGLHLKGRKT